MNKIISCCGCVCSECSYYPVDCAGCPKIEGKAFWLAFTGGQTCEIYECCIKKRRLAHCGRCGEFPCALYDQKDPTKSDKENEADFQKQIKQLRSMD